MLQAVEKEMTKVVAIDFEVFVKKTDAGEVVDWIVGRPYGEHCYALAVDNGGLAHVLPGSPLTLKLPQHIGVNKSFFEGYLHNYAAATFEKEGSIRLSQIVKLVPYHVEGMVADYSLRARRNLDTAIASLFLEHSRNSLRGK